MHPVIYCIGRSLSQRSRCYSITGGTWCRYKCTDNGRLNPVARSRALWSADVEAKDDDGKTAIQVVGMADDPVDPGGLDEIKKLLLENRAKR